MLGNYLSSRAVGSAGARDRGSHLCGFAQGLEVFSAAFVSTSEMYRLAASSSSFLVEAVIAGSTRSETKRTLVDRVGLVLEYTSEAELFCLSKRARGFTCGTQACDAVWRRHARDDIFRPCAEVLDPHREHIGAPIRFHEQHRRKDSLPVARVRQLHGLRHGLLRREPEQGHFGLQTDVDPRLLPSCEDGTGPQ